MDGVRARMQGLQGRVKGFEGRVQGFQAIELMVVMVIMGLVLAAAVPSFVQRNAWNRVEGAAREMSARMAIARSMSIAKRIDYRLVLSRSVLSYYFERKQDANTWVRDPDREFQVSGVAAMTSSANGDHDANEIYFETGGTIRQDQAPLQVHFVSSRGDTGTVVLVRTGRATVRVFRIGS